MQAGFATTALSDRSDSLSIDDYLIERPSDTVLITVKGDSMIDAGIYEGDILECSWMGGEKFIRKVIGGDEFLNGIDQEGSDELNPIPPKQFTTELYKKWFRSKTSSGFLAIKPWFEGMKFKIDIGKTAPEGKLISSTNVYLDAFDFAAYLKSIANGTAVTNYPANERTGIAAKDAESRHGSTAGSHAGCVRCGGKRPP